MRRAFALLGLSAMLFVAWLSLVPSLARATVEGRCTASIGGVDVTAGHDSPDTAIPLESSAQVPVGGTAEGRVIDLSYTVHVAGAGVRVGNVIIAEDGLSWTGTVNLEEFSGATVGLFEVTAEAQTEAGDCSGVAYVCIEGRSPLTTAAGAGATAIVAGGGILLALSLVRGGGLGVGRAAVQGFAGGATVGLGGAVLLQQFCTLPLTPASAAGIPIAIGAAGAVGSSLLRRAGTRGARRLAQRAPAHPGAEPTQAIERSAELRHAADTGAGGRELAGSGQGGSGPSPSGPAGSGGGGAPSGGSSGPAGGGAPGGSGPGAPSGGAPGGGPAPGGAGSADPAGGPAPSGPGGGGAPGGPAPSGPGGGGAPGGPEVSAGPPPPDTGIVIPPVPPPTTDGGNDCPNCGAENTPDSQFCTSCGTRLTT